MLHYRSGKTEITAVTGHSARNTCSKGALVVLRLVAGGNWLYLKIVSMTTINSYATSDCIVNKCHNCIIIFVVKYF